MLQFWNKNLFTMQNKLIWVQNFHCLKYLIWSFNIEQKLTILVWYNIGLV